MFKKIFPDAYISSVYNVDFNALYGKGFRLLLFDVDNTLVPHNAPADSRAIEFFDKIYKLGFKSMLLSNNAEPRVRDFCLAVKADGYLYKCGKPKSTSYKKAMQQCNETEKSTLFFGDQLFTDVLGAKNASIPAIMVLPVLKWKEEPQIILKRFLEAIVLLFYSDKQQSFDIPLIEKEQSNENLIS